MFIIVLKEKDQPSQKIEKKKEKKKEALFNRIALSLYNSLFGLSLSLNPMPCHELQNKFISFVLVEHY